MSGLSLNEVNNLLFHCDLVPNDPQIGVVPQTGVWGRADLPGQTLVITKEEHQTQWNKQNHFGVLM